MQTKELRNTILCGDVMEKIKLIPNCSINLVCTSPPYWGLRDYGTAIWDGGNNSECKHTIESNHDAKVKGRDTGLMFQTCTLCGARRIDKQWGLEEHPQHWVDKMVTLCRELRRVLRDDGVMYWNIGETYFNTPAGNDFSKYDSSHTWGRVRDGQIKGYQSARKQINIGKSNWLRPKQLLGLPWRFAIAMQNDGWLLRNAIIWFKSNAMPSSVTDRFSPHYEYVFLFAKRGKYWFDLDAVREPHQYPLDVVRRMNQDRLDGIQPFDKNSPLARRSTAFNLTKQQQHPNPTVRGFNERWRAKNLSEKGQTIHSMHENRAMGLGEPELNPRGKNPSDIFVSEKVEILPILAVETHTLVISVQEFENLKTLLAVVIDKLVSASCTVQSGLSLSNGAMKRQTSADFFEKFLIATPMQPNLFRVDTCPYATVSIEQSANEVCIEFGRNRWIICSENLKGSHSVSEQVMRHIFAVNAKIVHSEFFVLMNWVRGFKLSSDILRQLFINRSEAYSIAFPSNCDIAIREQQSKDVCRVDIDVSEILAVEFVLSVILDRLRITMAQPSMVVHPAITSTNGTVSALSDATFHDVVSLPAKFKNFSGDVWRITTVPHPFAHFAVMSEELVERCILSGCPKEVCVKCGKPRQRITNNPYKFEWSKEQEYIKKYNSKYVGEHKVHEPGQSMAAYRNWLRENGYPESVKSETMGWSDCGCNAGFKPGVVLDCFMGSGTVAVVAKRLGRQWVGIELNPEYAELAKKRLAGFELWRELVPSQTILPTE